jgi:hypothetical protein
VATKGTKPNRLTTALLETADDLRRVGVMDATKHLKITLRHLGETHALPDWPCSRAIST